MLSDLKFAFRQLGKSPGFATVAILSLALGIGANTAVFSVMNAVLLETLPVKNPHELFIFNWLADENVRPESSSGWQTVEPGTSKTTSTSFSIPAFEAFQKQAEPLADIFAFDARGGLNLNIDGAAEILSSGQIVSGNYHRALGVTARLGRLITPEDDTLAAEPVAVISYRYWQRRFGGSDSVLGKSITINGIPVTIVGVTAPAFTGTLQVGEAVDLTMPIGLDPRISRPTLDMRRPNHWWIRVMGRLKSGATVEQVRANLEGVFQETSRGTVEYNRLPGAAAPDANSVPLPKLRIAPGAQGLYEARRSYEKSIGLLTGVVALVLLIACANVANLLLARGMARRREIAVRLALGANRGRIVRQLLVESVLLAALGTAVGLLFAWWGADALIAMRPFGAGSLELDTSLDWRVLGFASVVALVTGAVFGLAPALRATKLDLSGEFQGSSRTLGAGSRSTLAKALMVVQVSLSLVLLVGAGLFVRTLRNLQNVDVGFNRESLLLFQMNARTTGSLGPQALAVYDRLRERFAALPGVEQVSYARIALLTQNNASLAVTVPGFTPKTNADGSARVNFVEPHYLATMEIPIIRGRDFNVRDGATSPKVAVVNQSFAKKYFGSEDAVGRRFGLGPNTTADIEIIGVTRDAQYSEVRGAPRPVALFPHAQIEANRVGVANFAVRFTGSDAALTAAIHSTAREIAPTLPVTNIRTQRQQIDRLFSQERLFATLCSILGGLALVLAAVGLYGLMSYAVLRRTGEIGLRMALGALPTQVLHMVLRESFLLVTAGVVLGLACAAGATRWISSMLFGLSPSDPLTYAAGALLLFAIALLACWLPARRAARVDPMVALRSE